jgi:hypothetical protein
MGNFAHFVSACHSGKAPQVRFLNAGGCIDFDKGNGTFFALGSLLKQLRYGMMAGLRYFGSCLGLSDTVPGWTIE